MRGYTLLEMLVVLAVLALIAVAAGQLVPTQRARSDPDAIRQDLSAAFAMARRTAIHGGEQIVVASEDSGATVRAGEVSVDIEGAKRVDIPRSIVVDANGFFSAGLILAISQDGDTLSYEVEPLTGSLSELGRSAR